MSLSLNFLAIALTKDRLIHQKPVVDRLKRISNSLWTRRMRRLGVLPKSEKENMSVCRVRKKQMERQE